MRRYVILVFVLFNLVVAYAQHIQVKSFQPLPMDMTAASLKGKRIDQNGQVAALIKIVTTETGFTFEGGTLGIVDSKQENGEVWVWVPRASRKITIKHQQLGVLRDYRYPVEIESERTYEMVLTTGKIETIVKEEVRQQYLTFHVSPANATLEVNDKLWSLDADGVATKYVEFGTYTYRVRAADYITDAGVVTVDDPDNKKIVPVTLKSDLAEVTLAVDADAEIWVNNEKKGIRTWTGPLGDGVYRIECKQSGHETTILTKQISKKMNGETITLPAPRPIYGSLNVESNPNMADLYIDGMAMGVTPQSFNEILVGSHEIKLVKEGYVDYIDSIVVNKDERTKVKASLQRVSHTQQPINEERQSPMVYFAMLNAAFSIAPQSSLGLTVGSVKDIGWYAHLGTNLTFRNASYECNYKGLIEGATFQYSYSGDKSVSFFMASAGIAFHMIEPLYAYVGAGYGSRNVYWKLNEGEWVKSVDDCYRGISVDAGLMLHFKNFGFSFGLQTMGFKYLEAKFGIGYTVKTK